MKKTVSVISAMALAIAMSNTASPAFAQTALVANPALCLAANPSLLGPSQNGHHYTASLNGVGATTTEVEVGDPARAGASGNVFLYVTTVVIQPEVTQTCLVLNKQGNATTKPTFTLVVQPEQELSRTEEEVKICQNVGGQVKSNYVTAQGTELGYSQLDCEGFLSDDA